MNTLNQQYSENAPNIEYCVFITVLISKLMNDNGDYQSDVLLVFEGEHDGDVAVQDPHELRQHV